MKNRCPKGNGSEFCAEQKILLLKSTRLPQNTFDTSEHMLYLALQ